jgi:O-antigen ligase
MVEVANAAAFWACALALILLPVGAAAFEICFGISMAAAALGLALERRQPLPHWAPTAAALVLVALVSSALSLDPGRSLRVWTKLLYLTAALGLLRGVPGTRAIAWIFMLFGAVVALHSVVAIGAWLEWGGEVRTEIDYLQLAQIAVMTLALVAPLTAARSLGPKLRIGALVLTLLLGAHAVLSGSRAALLCVGVLLLGELLQRSRRTVLLLPPLLFLVFAALPESRRERIRDALGVESEDHDPPSSLRMRLDMARTGLAIAQDRPWFGVGLDSVRLVYDAYKVGSLRDDPPASEGRRHRKWPNLHNDFVQIAAELGFLGLATYVTLLGSVLRRPPHVEAADSDDLAEALERGVRHALVLFALGGLFYKCFLNFYPWRLFVVLAGLEAAMRSRRSG